MVKKYIDFDGVIKDTHQILFEDYRECDSDIMHVQNKDWIYVLSNSPIINDAINIINEIDEAAVLTRVHSLENEAVAKIKHLRLLGLMCEIILVPYQLSKIDVAPAKDNILVDDAIFNLDEWEKAGGIPIFFDNRGNNIDGFGVENKKYLRIKSLEILKKY